MVNLDELKQSCWHTPILVFCEKTSELLELAEFEKKYVNKNIKSKKWLPLSDYIVHDICINGNCIQVSVMRIERKYYSL